MLTEPANFDEGDKPCPESNAGLLSIISFYWLNPLMVQGYKQPLVDDDLWALNADDQAPEVRDKFQYFWRQQMTDYTSKRRSSRPSLFSVFSKAFGNTMYFAGIFKFCQDLLGFLQPQLLRYIIRFVEDQQSEEPREPAWHGWGYCFAMFGTAALQSIMLHQYFHRVYKTGMRLRSSVMTATYEKSLVLSNTSRQQSTTGEIVNLMAVDAQRFMEVVTYLHMIWSAPLQIALALYFLYDLLGPSVFAGLAVMLLLIPVNGVLAKYQRSLTQTQMKFKDSRIKQMNEVLNGMKVLKLYSWERPFRELLSSIRLDELVALKNNAYLRALSTFSWTIAPFFVSLATFFTYTVVQGNNLTPEKAFVALSLFNLLRFPLVMLPMLITAVVQAQVSIKRVTSFLMLDEVDPNCVIKMPMPPAGSAGPADAVVIESGIFAWKLDGFNTVPTLTSINFRAAFEGITAVVGPVGCGKSSLVSAMLGNMEKMAGKVVCMNSTAYVPQNAWIQNATLRDNIIFNRPFDPIRYQRVIQACALTADLEILPAGDMTEIGEKGINLSGGQKQRVSLARAVYADAHVYLLDDPLSAVDSHVGQHIFDKVIGPNGLLKGKCRILVTHGIHFLPQCDKITVVKDGTIVEDGPYNVLLSNGDAFAAFIAEYANKDDQKTESAAGILTLDGQETSNTTLSATPAPKKLEAPLSPPTKTLLPKSGNAAEKLSLNDEDSKASEKAPLLGRAVGNLVKAESTEKGAVLAEIYRKYIGYLGKCVCVLLVLMYILAYTAQVGTNFWLAYWSSHEFEDDESTNDDGQRMSNADLGMYLGVYTALGVGYSSGMLVASIALALGGIRASDKLHFGMLSKILRAPMAFFDTTPMGRIVNRFSQDVYTVDEMIPRTLSSLISCAGQVISTIVVVSITTPIFLAAVAPLAILYYFIQVYYIKTSRQLKRLESVSRSPIYAHFSETLSGVSTICAYGSSQIFRIENENKVDYNLQAYYPSVAANRWLAMRLEMLGNFTILFAAMFIVADAKNIESGDAGLSLSYAMSVTQTLNWMVRMATELETNIVAVERMDEYTQIDSERPAIMPRRPALSWPSKGGIELRNLSVRYRAGLDLVLKGVNAVIKPGEKIGVVGRTGSGKSSLMISLFNIIEPATGSIIIDGEDVSKIGLEVSGLTVPGNFLR